MRHCKRDITPDMPCTLTQHCIKCELDRAREEHKAMMAQLAIAASMNGKVQTGMWACCMWLNVKHRSWVYKTHLDPSKNHAFSPDAMSMPSGVKSG